MDNFHDGTILCDHSLTIRHANQAAHNIFGYEIGMLDGLNVAALIPESTRHHHKSHTDQYLNNPQARRMNMMSHLTGLKRDGREIHLSISLNPINVEHESLVLASIRDVEDIVKLETELFHARKMEVVGKTSSGIIHDLKNVLQIINSSSHLARMELNEPSSAAHYLNDIDAQTELASAMLSGLLSFLKEGNPEPRRLNLNETIAKLQPIARSILPKTIHFSLDMDKKQHYIHSTSTTVDQILLNLLINASDAVHGIENPEICIKLQGSDIRQHEVILTVSDNGCGMSDEVKQNAFKAFFTTKVKKGTGLGLANVYGAVLDLSGEIQVTSEPGLGTSFEIMLPDMS